MPQNFFHRYYVPSNMVIGLVGDLDPDKVMPIVERYFGQLPTVRSQGTDHRRAAAEFGARSEDAGDGAALLP